MGDGVHPPPPAGLVVARTDRNWVVALVAAEKKWKRERRAWRGVDSVDLPLYGVAAVGATASGSCAAPVVGTDGREWA